jgi:uncharacterized phiE125 gp8 family phage protein
MNVVLKTAPTLEPITLAELCDHLLVDPDTLAENLTPYTSTAAGSHGVSEGGAYTHNGTAVEVIGKKALVYLRPVNNGAGATVDCKIQESDDNTTWTDWTGGAFTQVTEANDTTIQEKEYTGAKRYIRTAAKVLVGACEFGTDIIVKEPVSAESDLLTAIIQASREHVEDYTRRALLTQTWYYYLDEWPDQDFIKLPFGNLQTVTSVKYKDSDGTETTMTVTTEYLVETNGDGIGRIVLPYGVSWPSFTSYPSNPITIEFVCGWTAAALIPSKIRAALKMICFDLYTNRESRSLTANTYTENPAVKALLASSRLWDEF